MGGSFRVSEACDMCFSGGPRAFACVFLTVLWEGDVTLVKLGTSTIETLLNPKKDCKSLILLCILSTWIVLAV